MSSGHHSVTITQMQGESVDYLIITPGNDTPLDGETLVVDDTYSGIHYSGSGWISVTSDFGFLQYTTVHAQAFQNGTHQTSSVGDSFTFSYTGQLFFMIYLLICLICVYVGMNMTAYGILPRPDGSLSLSYTIDGGSATTVSHKIINTATDTLNYPMVQTGSLVAGDHTITVTLTDINSNQTFILDYITYMPSFQNLATMPLIKSSSESSNSSTPPEGTSSLGDSDPSSPSSSLASAPSSSNTSSPGTSDPSSSHDPSVSALSLSSSHHANVIAGSIGGVSLLAISFMVVFYFIRRRRPSGAKTKSTGVDPYPSQ
jgi:hypothetical protein